MCYSHILSTTAGSIVNIPKRIYAYLLKLSLHAEGSSCANTLLYYTIRRADDIVKLYRPEYNPSVHIDGLNSSYIAN